MLDTQEVVSSLQANASRPGALQKLDSKTCVQQYSATVNTIYSNLVIVVDVSGRNNSVLDCVWAGRNEYNDLPYDDDQSPSHTSWLTDNWGSFFQNTSGWFFGSNQGPVAVEYCLAQPLGPWSTIELNKSEQRPMLILPLLVD